MGGMHKVEIGDNMHFSISCSQLIQIIHFVIFAKIIWDNVILCIIIFKIKEDLAYRSSYSIQTIFSGISVCHISSKLRNGIVVYPVFIYIPYLLAFVKLLTKRISLCSCVLKCLPVSCLTMLCGWSHISVHFASLLTIADSDYLT